MPPRPCRLTILVAVGLFALGCTACGRRGALEPADAQGPASARTLPRSVGLGNGTAGPDPVAVQEGDEVAVSAVPATGDAVPVKTSRGAKRGYTVPKEPFFLDPLL